MLTTFKILLMIFMFLSGAVVLGAGKDNGDDLIGVYAIMFCVSAFILFLTYYTL